MCNPRRIRIQASRRLAQSWEQEVRRQVTLHGEAVGRAEVREPLGSLLGGPVLATLERALEDHHGWHAVADGYRYDVDGGHAVFLTATRELLIVAEARSTVSAQSEASARTGGTVEETLRVEGEGRYYDDGWGGLTVETARRAAGADAQRRLAQAAEERLDQVRADAEASLHEEVEARARADAETSLTRAQEVASADLAQTAADRLEVIGARVREAFNQVLALAYRDAIVAYAHSRRAQGLQVSQDGGVLSIEFEMEA